MRITKGALALALVAVVAAACTGTAATPSPAATAAPTAAPATAAPATPAPTPTPDACAPENLALRTPGMLTIGTDNPAFPPYFEASEASFAPGFENLGYTGDPASGKGFESATAYAVAEQLGFGKDQVTWVVVPFANAIAPGPKTFDFLINQVSYTPERAGAVDLTDGYYELNQAVVALKDNPVAKATTVAELKSAKLGAMTGTTSLKAIEQVIAPTTEFAAYDTNDAAITALKVKQIDAIVVDLPTSDFITRVQIDDGSATIVGQLAPFGGTPEYFSLLLEKGSALTPCVNAALGALREAGTLDELATTGLPFQEAIPVLK